MDIDLVEAIRALTPRQRAVVVLYYFEDRPVHEVADLVGCSASTVTVHLHRARTRLAEILGEEVEANAD
jgi:RNA polymerase sigma-70 factor (ECF subfamily)